MHIQTKAFISFRYIYSDVLDLSIENVFGVLYVAEKYLLSTMKNECSSLLSSSVETSNALVVFNVASHFQLQTLITKSLNHIQKNAVECLLASNSMKISKLCMESILRLDSLSCSETDICRFFLKWAIHQCESEGKTASGENMRNIAGSLLYLVNFPQIDKPYFANEIARSGLLTLEEIVSVFYSHYGRENDFFGTSVRKLFYEKKYNILRHTFIQSGWSPYTGIKYDALKILVNRNIELKAVILYGPSDQILSSTNQIIVKILNDEENEIYYETHETCTHTGETHTINLSKPIIINANRGFTIMVNSLKCKLYYGTQCKPECKIDDIIVKFETSIKCTTATRVDQGQIAGIEFNA